jgi:plasmid stabilization system protein ParE
MGLKALRIRWAEPAERDFDALLSYIAFESPEAARHLFAKVMEAIEHAARFPESARFIPELGRSYRELLAVRPFRLIYRIAGKELRIIGVMRMEQDFDPDRFMGS